jgi:hypothetical protein
MRRGIRAACGILAPFSGIASGEKLLNISTNINDLQESQSSCMSG